MLLVEIDAGAELTAENYRAHVAVMTSMFGSGAYVLSQLNGARTTTEMRKMLVGASVEQSATRATALVVQTKLGQMLGHFVTRVARPQFAVQVCSTLSEGHAWLVEQMEQDNFDLSTLRPLELGAIAEFPNAEHGVGDVPRI